jgi:hypothetical protein
MDSNVKESMDDIFPFQVSFLVIFTRLVLGVIFKLINIYWSYMGMGHM